MSAWQTFLRRLAIASLYRAAEREKDMEKEEKMLPVVRVRALKWSAEPNGDFIAVSAVGWYHIGYAFNEGGFRGFARNYDAGRKVLEDGR